MGKLKDRYIDDEEWYDYYYSSQDVYESERRPKRRGNELDYQYPTQGKPARQPRKTKQ